MNPWLAQHMGDLLAQQCVGLQHPLNHFDHYPRTVCQNTANAAQFTSNNTNYKWSGTQCSEIPKLSDTTTPLITMSKYLQLQMVWHVSSVVKYFTGKQIRQLNSSLHLKGNERCILGRYLLLDPIWISGERWKLRRGSEVRYAKTTGKIWKLRKGIS